MGIARIAKKTRNAARMEATFFILKPGREDYLRMRNCDFTRFDGI